jgi:hypothetical protein
LARLVVTSAFHVGISLRLGMLYTIVARSRKRLAGVLFVPVTLGSEQTQHKPITF